MAYDSARGEVLLFGTNVDGGPPVTSETWAWRAGNWTKLAVAKSPPARTWAGMAYDETRRRVVLFGGQAATEQVSGQGLPALADTWTWDGQSWSELRPSTHPPAAVGPVLAYDAKLGQVVAVVDSTTSDSTDTWVWNGSTWTRLQLAVTPPAPRINEALAYDVARASLVLFGHTYCSAPYQCTPDADTWTFDGSAWTRHKAPPGAIPAREMAAMAYDPSSQTVVLTGGRNDFTFLADTWAWDGTVWRRQQADNGPSPRAGGRMVYDTADHQAILYGGEWNTQSSGLTYFDVWAWANGAWSQLQPTTIPAPAEDRPAILRVASHGPGLLPSCPASPPCMSVDGQPELGLNAAYVVFNLTPPQGQKAQCVSYLGRNQPNEAWQLVGVSCGPRGGLMPRVGAQARISVSGCANVRSFPLHGPVVDCLRDGTTVTLDDGPAVVVLDPSSNLWWHISGKGWVAHALLLPSAAP